MECVSVAEPIQIKDSLSPAFSFLILFVEPWMIPGCAFVAAVVETKLPKASTFCSGSYNDEPLELDIVPAVVPPGTTMMAHFTKPWFPPVPAFRTIDNSHLKPVIVPGNDAAEYRSTSCFTAAKLVKLTHTSFLSMGLLALLAPCACVVRARLDIFSRGEAVCLGRYTKNTCLHARAQKCRRIATCVAKLPKHFVALD